MDLNQTGKLLSTIGIHYPLFRKHITDSAGNISKATAEEWMRCIGYLDYDEAVKKFDKYLEQSPDKNSKAPDTSWFKSYKSPEDQAVVRDTTRHQFKVENGRLFDEEFREYGVPGNENSFYYDANGHICQTGRVIIP